MCVPVKYFHYLLKEKKSSDREIYLALGRKLHNKRNIEIYSELEISQYYFIIFKNSRHNR